ncbi:unnamed protein product, partial [Hapterophycus canaliculatus]
EQTSLRALLPRFHYFRQGNCIVHHMFGDDVSCALPLRLVETPT